MVTRYQESATGASIPVTPDAPFPVTIPDASIGLLATEATQVEIRDELQTAATDIPHFALDATSDLSRVYGSGSTVAEASLVAAVSGQTTRVHKLRITSAGAGYVEFRDGSAGTVLELFPFPAAGAYVIDFDPRPLFKTSANTALYWYRSAAVAMTVTAHYVTS